MAINVSGGNSLESEIARSYNSFSGSDIRAVIGNIPFAEIQAISYSVTREKAPIYTMGSPDPRSFSRNKRGVAGSLVWINFDRHALLNVIYQASGVFVANVDDVRPEFNPASQQAISQTAVFTSSLFRPVPIPIPATVDAQDVPINTVSGFKQEATPWYSDQILPFDVTLAATNEIGAASTMKIFGVEILNEGSGVSIDDAVTEMQATWVARLVEPWQAVQTAFPDLSGVGGS
jgi:hypothetical protein